jgi:hypothetical protein
MTASTEGAAELISNAIIRRFRLEFMRVANATAEHNQTSSRAFVFSRHFFIFMLPSANTKTPAATRSTWHRRAGSAAIR